MDAITLHDAFIPQDFEGRRTLQPAVFGWGQHRWGHACDAVTTQGGG